MNERGRLGPERPGIIISADRWLDILLFHDSNILLEQIRVKMTSFYWADVGNDFKERVALHMKLGFRATEYVEVEFDFIE